MVDVHFACQDIFSDITGHINGVFGGGEGGRVAEFQTGEVIDTHASADGGGDYVAAFVDAVFAGELSA